MDRHEAIDRLTRRLQGENGGPLAYLADQAVDAFASRARALAAWVREGVEKRPLVSLLCASGWVSPPVGGGRAVRSVNLLKVAFDAEPLRLRATIAGQGIGAAVAFIA